MMDTIIDLLKPSAKIIKPEEIHQLIELGEFGAILEWTVQNPKTGKITEHRVKKSESFLQQFIQLIYAMFSFATYTKPVSMKDYGGTTRSVFCSPQANTGYLSDCYAAAGTVTFGILIGTDNGGIYPLAMDNYHMGALIATATLPYSAVSYGTPGSDGTTFSQVTITRNFGAGAGPVTVQEIGLACRGLDITGPTCYFLIIRDIIAAGGIVVPAGQTLTVNYRPQASI